MGVPPSNCRLTEKVITRRNFLRLGVLTTLGSISPGFSLASIPDPPPAEKALSLYNIHTDEHIRVVYWIKGRYLPNALREIDHIMRDYRTNEVREINRNLIELLYDINQNLDTRQSFNIVSGYRSRKTNLYLYRHTPGVNKNSLHMYGMAVDVNVPHCDLSKLGKIARSMRAGGVGMYRDSNFVHIDVGQVRYW